MPETKSVQTKQISANGVNFFCQVRGLGPVVLLIPGIGGDCGVFEMIARQLADEFKVVSYDRRGMSRTPPPVGWHTTSMAEQAEDAAAILKGLKIKNAAIFGTGSGGLIALELMLRYPQLVRKAILHDPLLYTVLQGGPYDRVYWDMGQVLRTTFAMQGAMAAMNAILRWEFGMEAMQTLPGELLRRIINNGEHFVMADFPSYSFYKPDEAKMAAVRTPAKVLFSTNTPPWRREIASWLGKRINASVEPFLGEHATYIVHPLETAEALRLHLE